jgi:hypothetical protein
LDNAAFSVVGDPQRQPMPHAVNVHLRCHAPTELGVPIVECVPGWVHVCIGGHGPECLIDRSEIGVGLDQAVPARAISASVTF